MIDTQVLDAPANADAFIDLLGWTFGEFDRRVGEKGREREGGEDDDERPVVTTHGRGEVRVGSMEYGVPKGVRAAIC